MSSGHNYSLKVPAHSMAVLNQILLNPAIVARLQAPVRIDRTYDIPFLAGYSADGKTIYIDRTLPPQLPLKQGHNTFEQPQAFNPIPFLLSHEKIEKAVIDTFGWSYDHAHQLATNFERRNVLQAGINWHDYEDAFEGYIRIDETRQLQRVPADLDMTPYLQDEKKLIPAMQKAMVPNESVPNIRPGGPPNVMGPQNNPGIPIKPPGA